MAMNQVEDETLEIYKRSGITAGDELLVEEWFMSIYALGLRSKYRREITAIRNTLAEEGFKTIGPVRYILMHKMKIESMGSQRTELLKQMLQVDIQ